jgi:ribosomal-protein-alanine N-acetyltransferase
MTNSVALSSSVSLRRLEAGDAPALLEAYLRSRDHLRRFEPVRPESFWTLQGQQDRLDSMLKRQAEGDVVGFAMFRDHQVLGCITVNNIVRGPFLSAHLGYWVHVDEVGQGLASATVAAVCRIADGELGLHRLEASTLLTNVASQRVLAKNGFEEFGLCRRYLHINGTWGDSLIFQRILNDRPPLVT